MNQNEYLRDQLRSRAWREFSRGYLRRHPTCVICGAPSRQVDHIVDRRVGGSLLDYANVQAMCKSCHSKKTASRPRAKMKPRIDARTGLKIS